MNTQNMAKTPNYALKYCYSSALFDLLIFVWFYLVFGFYLY